MSDSQNVVLITGSAGFLGQYFSQHYFQRGWNVVGIDAFAAENVSTENLSSYYQIKLPDSGVSSVLMSHKFDLCIHCAGSASINMSVEDPGTDFYSSTVVTFELLNALRLYAPGCRFVYLSSAAVYGNPETLPIEETGTELSPVSPYGFHKLQCEKICSEFSSIYNIPTASARIFSAYGPGLRRQVIWDIIQKAEAESHIVLQGTGLESRDFIHASDIANAIACIGKNASMEGEVYNVANGLEITINDLAKLIVSKLSSHVTIEFDGKVPKGVPLNWCSDNSKLQSLGFESNVSLNEGITEFTSWALKELGN